MVSVWLSSRKCLYCDVRIDVGIFATLGVGFVGSNFVLARLAKAPNLSPAIACLDNEHAV
jgi:hypothetical protein